MSNCVYESYTGQAFGLVQLIPWVIPSFLTAGSITKDRRGRFGFEFTPFWFSFYLTVWQLLIYELQMSFRMMKSDPFCSVISSTFPSTSTFYITAGISFIILFTFIWNVPLSWQYWLYLLVFVIVPPSYLVWLEYNEWWEILISVALGVIASATYFLVLWTCISKNLHYILNSTPCTWFHVVDTYLMDKEQEAEYEKLRLQYEEIDAMLPSFLTW